MKKDFDKTNVYLKAAIRRIWRWSKARREALEEAKDSKGRFKCAECKKLFGRKEIIVDHVSPVVSVEDGFVNWQIYIDRMFVPSSKLQVLCKKLCHKLKTNLENKERRRVKKSKGC